MKREKKSDKIYIIETIVLEYLLCLGLLRGYLQNSELWSIWLFRIGVILLFLSPRVYELIKENWKICVLMAASVAFFYLSAEIAGDLTYVESNFKESFYTFFIIILVFVIFHSNKEFIWNVLKHNFLLFNGFFIANIIIVTIQTRGTPLLIKPEWLDINPFYPDQCAGLFGNSGTHRLAFFCVFVLLYNLQYSMEISRIHIRLILKLYTFLTAGFMLYLSTKNENTFLFVLYFVAVMLFYLVRAKYLKMSPKEFLLILVPIVVLGIVLLCMIPSVSSFVNDYVINRLASTANGVFNSSGFVNERMSMVIDAMHRETTYLAGYGLGSCRWGGTGLFGFIHFGMNSVSSFIILGGIWFYGLVSLLYTYTLYCIKTTQRSWGRFWAILLIMQMLSFYTTIFTTQVLIVWLVFSVITITQTVNCLSCESVLEYEKNHSIALIVINGIKQMQKSQWRKAVLFGVIGAIVFGGVRIARGVMLWDTQQIAYEQAYDDYLEALPEYERQLGNIDFEIGNLEESFLLGQLSEEDYKKQDDKIQLERRVFVRNRPQEPKNKPTVQHSVYRIIVFSVLGFLVLFYSAVLRFALGVKVSANK